MPFDGIPQALFDARYLKLDATQVKLFKTWNGTMLEKLDFTVTESDDVITGKLEKTGTGDLTMVFSDGFSVFDCTPKATVILTAGSDTSPQINFLYILQSDKSQITKSISGWPTTEHIRIAEVILQSAATTQTEGGALVNQNWNDFTAGTNNQGHFSHAWERLRFEHSVWKSGAATTWTITTNAGSADNVDVAVTAAKVYQLHLHDFESKDTSGADNVHVVNHYSTPYTEITDFATLLTDSDNDSMSGKYFNLVLWGSISSGSEVEHLFVNLPSGSYNKQGDAKADVSGFTDFTIPSNFRGKAFLISRITLRHQTAQNGTWTSIQETDLRGQIPNIIAGGGTAAITTEFSDNQFKLFDEGDPTKEIAFQASGITTGNTRTLTSPDESGTLALNRLTTKGDLRTFSTVDLRLGVGGNDEVLTADSAQASGVKWAAVAAGGQTLYDAIVASSGGDYTSIATACSTENANATIFIRQGTYTETTITMKNGQKLIGENRHNTIIDFNDANENITATSLTDGVQIRNLLIKGSQSGTSGTINITTSPGSIFDNLRIEAAATPGRGINGTASNCIYKNLIITGFTNSSNRYGIINQGTNNYYFNNLFDTNYRSLVGGLQSVISGNVFKGSSNDAIISVGDCVITGNLITLSGGDGIDCNGTGAVITGNRFSGNGNAIRAQFSNITIVSNFFNSISISVTAGFVRSTIANNTFIGENQGIVGAIGINNNISNNIGEDQLKYEVTTVIRNNTSGSSVAAGDIVVLAATTNASDFTTTTTQGDDKVYGMATETIANGADGFIQILGKTTVLKVDGTTDIAIGDFIGTFTTAKIGMKAAAGDMAIAIALEAYATDDSAGILNALLISPRKI